MGALRWAARYPEKGIAATRCGLDTLVPRKRKDIAPEDYARITAWAATGLSQVQIAERLDMSVDAFRKRLQDDEQVYHAYMVGLAAEEEDLVGVLKKTAMDTSNPRSTTAGIFLLKSRHRYSDQPPPQPAIQVTNNTLNLKFPKPIPLNKLSAMADHLAPGSVIENERPALDHDLPDNAGGPRKIDWKAMINRR